MAGYLITDRRRVASVPELDVKDPVLAKQLASMPLSEVDSGLDAYEPPEGKKPIEYNIKPLSLHFGEYLKYHSLSADAGGWMKQFKALLPGVVSDASLLVMGDIPVATFARDSRLNKKRLDAEQPHIVAKYTKMAWVEVFDEEAFKTEMPDVHAAYRGRSLRLKRSGPGAGLILPTP